MKIATTRLRLLLLTGLIAMVASLTIGAGLAVAQDGGDEAPRPGNIRVQPGLAGSQMIISWSAPTNDSYLHWVGVREAGTQRFTWVRALTGTRMVLFDAPPANVEAGVRYEIRIASARNGSNEVSFSEIIEVTAPTAAEVAPPFTWWHQQHAAAIAGRPPTEEQLAGVSVDGDAEMFIVCHARSQDLAVSMHWQDHEYLPLFADIEIAERMGLGAWRSATWRVLADGGHILGRTGDPAAFLREVLAVPFFTLQLSNGADAVFPTGGLRRLFENSDVPGCGWEEVLN